MAFIREPTDTFLPGGKLRECDICGLDWRENQLVRQEDGYYHCPFDIDVLRQVEEEQRIMRIGAT